MSVLTRRVEKLEKQNLVWDGGRLVLAICGVVRAHLPDTDDAGQELPPEPKPLPVIPPESDIGFWGPDDDKRATNLGKLLRSLLDTGADDGGSARP